MTAKMYERTCQTVAAAFHISLWIIAPLISLWLPAYILFFTRFWPLMIIYGIWFFSDRHTPARGSRSWPAFKQSRLWKWFADYFPIRLVKTADLPAGRNYILGCHPHGVLSVGAFTHLCTNGTNFQQAYPDLEPTILTLTGQFYFPFRREFGIALGGVESSATSLDYLLRSTEKSRIVGIVVGGSEEALDAHNGEHIVNLKCRRGFCKFALRYGASLVPSYSFGENEIFEQSGNHRGTKLRAVQRKIKQLIGFCPPLFRGTGVLNTRIGLLPLRRPITTVIGAPIDVPRIKNPTVEDVNALHARYTHALCELFDAHKAQYANSPDDKLIIV